MILSDWVLCDDICPNLRDLRLTEGEGAPLGYLLDKLHSVLNLRFVREDWKVDTLTESFFA